MMTGLTPKTFENLQLNAGVFLKNFNYDDFGTLEELEEAVLAALEDETVAIGATIGGGTFQAVPTIRRIEADGMRYPIVGSTVNDMWSIKLTGTMKEITPQSFANVLMCADIDHVGEKVSVVKVRTDIAKTDYIPSLSWFGDTSKGMVLIGLKNALNLTGAKFTFTDKGEGSLPFEFEAHQATMEDMKYAPFDIRFLER